MAEFSRRQLIAGSSATVAPGARAGGTGIEQRPSADTRHQGGTIHGPPSNAIDGENLDLRVPPSIDAGRLPNLKFAMSDARLHLLEGGWSHQVDVQQMPIAIIAHRVEMRLEPAAIRELPWHQQAEWAIMLAGRARVSAVDDPGRSFIGDVSRADRRRVQVPIPGHDCGGARRGEARTHARAPLTPKGRRVAPTDMVHATLNLDRRTIAKPRKSETLVVS